MTEVEALTAVSRNVEFTGEEKKVLEDSGQVEAIICLANRFGEEPGWLSRSHSDTSSAFFYISTPDFKTIQNC